MLMRKKDKNLEAQQLQPYPLAQEGKSSAAQRGRSGGGLTEAVHVTAARVRFPLNVKGHGWVAARDGER